MASMAVEFAALALGPLHGLAPDRPGLRARMGSWRRTRRRVALAAGLERAASEPWRSRGLTCAVPADAPAVRLARVDLLALAAMLRGTQRVAPAGLAIVERLLCDGTSPLYRPRWPGELRDAALAARAALEGRVVS